MSRHVDPDALDDRAHGMYEKLRAHRDRRAAEDDARAQRTTDSECWALARAMTIGEEMDDRYSRWASTQWFPHFTAYEELRDLLREATAEVRKFPHQRTWSYRKVEQRRRQRERREAAEQAPKATAPPAGRSSSGPSAANDRLSSR